MSLEQQRWYKNAVIYAVDVSSFRDANGDGIGDLAGVEEKLDHIAELGVTCLWLLPFYPSSGRDNGYDVTHHVVRNVAWHRSGDFTHLGGGLHISPVLSGRRRDRKTVTTILLSRRMLSLRRIEQYLHAGNTPVER